jgi:hypothetical protein
MTTYKPYRLDSLRLVIVHGGAAGKEEIVDSFNPSEMQVNLADARDPWKAIRAQGRWAILGVRGDKLRLEASLTYDSGGSGAEDDEKGLPWHDNALGIEVLDFTCVPAEVQHGAFGVYSPWKPNAEKVTPAMLVGIDRRVRWLSPNNVFYLADVAAMSTPKSQYVGGVLDSRVTLYCDNAAAASVTKITLQIAPGSDGVIVVDRGIVFGRQNLSATKNYGFGTLKTVA